MKKLIILLKNLLFLNDCTTTITGLSQFKQQTIPAKMDKSIKSKDIRLSELMRRY